MPHSPLQGEQSAAAEHVTQLLTGVLSLLNRRVAHPDLERQAPGDFVDITAVAPGSRRARSHQPVQELLGLMVNGQTDVRAHPCRYCRPRPMCRWPGPLRSVAHAGSHTTSWSLSEDCGINELWPHRRMPRNRPSGGRGGEAGQRGGETGEHFSHAPLLVRPVRPLAAPGSGLLEADFGRPALSGVEGTTAVWLVAEAPPRRGLEGRATSPYGFPNSHIDGTHSDHLPRRMME